MEQFRLVKKLKKLGVKDYRHADFSVSFFEERKEELQQVINQPEDRQSNDLPSYVKDIMGDEFENGK